MSTIVYSMHALCICPYIVGGNGPDAKHHDNLQGTVFEDTENSQEQSAFARRQNGHWYLQTYQSYSFGLPYSGKIWRGL